MNLEWKQCPNCGDIHCGQFDDCYPCFDCETEEEYVERREFAVISRRVENDLVESRMRHQKLWNY